MLDCANLNDFSGITRNKAKFALGSLSIIFDLIFLVQHYCLYNSPHVVGEDDSGDNTTTTTTTTIQNEPLLPPALETEEIDGTARGRTFTEEVERERATPPDSSADPQMIFV